MNNYQTLEDSSSDVIDKALAMVGLSRQDLPTTPSLQHKFLVQRLHLDAHSCINLPTTIAMQPLPDGLSRHTYPFYTTSLNIWTLQTHEGLIAIDTGCSPEQLNASVGEQTPQAILITHLHHDHIGGLKAFPEVPIWRPPAVSPRSPQLTIAGLTWQIFDLGGHTPEGIGWHTIWQGQSLFFSGDSIFAGSIGKCPANRASQYKSNILHVLKSLPDNTIICPGHGPATTIIDEWKRNPFFSLDVPSKIATGNLDHDSQFN